MEKRVNLCGYCDPLSGSSGETIDFKVSSYHSQPYQVELYRSISADPNPASIGIVEERVEESFETSSFPSKAQPFYPGSFGITESPITIKAETLISISCFIFPTLRKENKLERKNGNC